MGRIRNGIMLITTLLVLALLTIMTVGFVTANRDNLMLAANSSSQEKALEAALSGLQYVQMRITEDGNFGNDINPGSTSIKADASGFLSYETKSDVVGILSNGDSHFQIHFYCGGCATGSNTSYKDNDSSLQYPNGTLPASPDSSFNTNNLSINNLASANSTSYSGRIIPANSALIISVGYSQGVTRVVEALLRKTAYTNSSVMSGGDISVDISCTGSTGWNLQSNDPLSNNIRAGVKWVSASNAFVNNGGNVNCTGCTVNAGNNPTDVKFASSVSGANNAGAAFALENGSTGGKTTLGAYSFGNGGTYPGTTSDNTSDSSGTFYANSSNTGNPPNKLIGSSDVINQIKTQETGPTSVALYSGSLASCATKTCIFGFQDHNGNGDRIDVYDSNGNPIATNVNSLPGFKIKNFQLQLQPNTNVTINGNMMLTLEPSTTTSGSCSPTPCFVSTNMDSKGNNVLPTLALGYTDTNKLGNQPSTLQITGNLYIQGQIAGWGGIAAATGTSATSWVPSSCGSCPYASGSWAATEEGAAAQPPPTSGTGNVYLEGNSINSSLPSKSFSIYADGNVKFNPIPTSAPSGTSSNDANAYANALDNLACQNTTCNDTNAWKNSFQNVDLDQLDNFLDYDSGDQTSFLRNASMTSSCPTLSGSGCGANKAYVGTTVTSGLLASITDPAVGTFLGCTLPCTGANITLYQYVAVEQYQTSCATSCDTSWLVAPPVSGNPNQIEQIILSQTKQYANQAKGANDNFGYYVYSSLICAPSCVAGTTYSAQDMNFPGLVYVNGGGGFQANTDCHQLVTDGALITTTGSVNISNTSGVTFTYDPSQLYNYLPSTNTNGYKTQILWITVW